MPRFAGKTPSSSNPRFSEPCIMGIEFPFHRLTANPEAMAQCGSPNHKPSQKPKIWLARVGQNSNHPSQREIPNRT
jgi:hypothetical protein